MTILEFITSPLLAWLGIPSLGVLLLILIIIILIIKD